jgi:predicted phage-related endonuclease
VRAVRLFPKEVLVPLTEKQLEARKGRVFSSDVAKVLNISKWGNASDLYHEIVDGISTFTSGKSAMVGSICEDAVLSWYQLETDYRIHRNPGKRVKGLLGCHPDALVKDNPSVHVQAKTAGILHSAAGEAWGEDRTDEIPVEYIVQCQAEMAILGTNRADVPALIGNRGFALFSVERNEKLIEHIEHMVEIFWRRHVEAKVPPEEVASLDTYKLIEREEGKVVEFDEDQSRLVEAWETTKAVKNNLDRGCDGQLACILKALGDGEIAKLWDGREFTYLEQRSAPTYDKAKMEADGVLDKYQRENKARVARTRKPRK